jgi:hypothetical protein
MGMAEYPYPPLEGKSLAALWRLTKPTSAASGYNKLRDKRGGGTGGIGSGKTGKTEIIGAVRRKGNVVARAIESTDTEMMEDFVREAMSNKVSPLCTDQHSAYRKPH